MTTVYVNCLHPCGVICISTALIFPHSGLPQLQNCIFITMTTHTSSIKPYSAPNINVFTVFCRQQKSCAHSEPRQIAFSRRQNVKLASEKILALSPAYRVDYEGVLHGVACLLHVSNSLKLLLVIFAVYVLILENHEVELTHHRFYINIYNALNNKTLFIMVAVLKT